MRIELIVEATEQPNRPPAINRLRSCLKGMLRSYGVKVVSAREIKPKAAADDDDRKQATRKM